MRPRSIHLNDIQALILLKALLQLLLRKALPQNHGLDELELDAQRSGRCGVVSNDVEDSRRYIFSAPFAFTGALVSPIALVVVCQARFAHVSQATRAKESDNGYARKVHQESASTKGIMQVIDKNHQLLTE